MLSLICFHRGCVWVRNFYRTFHQLIVPLWPFSASPQSMIDREFKGSGKNRWLQDIPDKRTQFNKGDNWVFYVVIMWLELLVQRVPKIDLFCVKHTKMVLAVYWSIYWMLHSWKTSFFFCGNLWKVHFIYKVPSQQLANDHKSCWISQNIGEQAPELLSSVTSST